MLQKKNSPSVEAPLKLDLKQLFAQLQYACLEVGQKLPVIVATDLAEDQKNQLLNILKKQKRDIAWKISNIKGTSPTVCMHRIFLKENSKNSIEI